MFVELHLLQNFAPSNLNRDDTGAPKDCEFGGYRRARISSQCLKRAIRKSDVFIESLDGPHGVRTRRLIVEVAERLANRRPAPQETVKLVSEVFKEAGLQRGQAKGSAGNEEDATKILIYMDRPAINEMVELFQSHRDDIEKGSKESKQRLVSALAEALVSAVKSPDIALFGRMIEVDPKTEFGKRNLKINAACQVAHAISTNRVSMEFDFFTAVDDLKPRDEDPGAGMLGTVEFNSACYYRYANIDAEQLKRNLQGDENLARATIRAFIEASIAAIPTGKQNSMAAQNPPSFVMAVVRERGLWSLANAFLKPVAPRGDQDLMHASIQALDRYWGKLTRMYGNDGISGPWVALLDDEVSLASLSEAVQQNVSTLIDEAVKSVAFNGSAAQAG